MSDFGGIIRFTFGGTPIKVRAKFELEPAGASYTAEDNQDGTFDRYVQPMGPKWDIEFVDSVDGTTATSLPWDSIMKGGPYNMAALEDSNGLLHTFTNAKFLGRPKIDRLKGLVTGITGQCPVGGYSLTTSG